ncbi:PTS system IIA component, L-Asc family [Marinococcus luteus]|uniref:Ascorbate-specific PTS system EIIA component n=1 Tax=Marinococcus luteus TaxID=1122204 RepID=A0A1H2QLD2_9BACI|nr:PTS sugar transporter subunit IIA [Marinococcus luteus]SDW08007.1 PTS system IIA component, L-Asc family [Marinococcus luteus]
MLSDYLKNNIQFLDSVSSWEESIQIGAAPLLTKNKITSEYVQEMISNVNENGPYIVIVPGIAMPHAQNQGSVLETGISLLNLKEPVLYPENKEVRTIIVLAAEDSEGHLELISDLSSVLIDESTMNEFKNAQSENEILELLDREE